MKKTPSVLCPFLIDQFQRSVGGFTASPPEHLA
jgi:hypothetical protein